MSGLVAAVKNVVPSDCQSSRCRKDGCSVSMKDAPSLRVIVDLDCKALKISGSRCDYLFVSEDKGGVSVALIELKSGTVKASEVEKQLQGGAQYAQQFFTAGDQLFHFAPVLVRGKRRSKQEYNKLRQAKIKLQDKIRQPKVIESGAPITKVLATRT